MEGECLEHLLAKSIRLCQLASLIEPQRVLDGIEDRHTLRTSPCRRSFRV